MTFNLPFLVTDGDTEKPPAEVDVLPWRSDHDFLAFPNNAILQKKLSYFISQPSDSMYEYGLEPGFWRRHTNTQ